MFCSPRHRRLAMVVILGMALTLAPAPAKAQEGDPAAEQERARQRQSELDADLDDLTASEAELEAAVEDLDAEVAARQGRLAEARTAAAAAARAVATSQDRVREATAQMETMRVAMTALAVDQFMAPPGDTMADWMVRAESIDDAGRRRALLGAVASADQETVDQYAAAREGLLGEQGAAEEAAAAATRRRDEAQAEADRLQAARAEKAEAEAALQARIEGVVAESEALAAEQAGLTALIQAEQARRAAEPAPPPEAAEPDDGEGEPGPGAVVAPPAQEDRPTAPAPPPAEAPEWEAPASTNLIWPARGTVTSEFGMRWGRLHAGIDIANSNGTPIVAAKAGVVIFAGWKGGYGNAVIVDHGGGLSTLYGHQSALAVGYGQRVGQGQRIGSMGSTGNSTGPHLHFETRVNGTPRNPRSYLP